MTHTEHLNESHRELDSLLNDRLALNKKITALIVPAIADIIRSFGDDVKTLDFSAIATDCEHEDTYEARPGFDVCDRRGDCCFPGCAHKATVGVSEKDGGPFVRHEIHDEEGYTCQYTDMPGETSHAQNEDMYGYLMLLRRKADEGGITVAVEGRTAVLEFADSGESSDVEEDTI